MNRKFISIIILLVIIPLLGINYYSNTLAVNFEGSREVIFKIDEGESANAIVYNLRNERLIDNGFAFRFYIFLKKLENKFQIGEYKLYAGMKMEDIANILTSKNALREIKITIIEDWDSKKIAEYLEERKLAKKDDFLKIVNGGSQKWLEIYDFLKDKPALTGLEGYLFPDTYQVYIDSNAKEIIEKMLDNFNKKLNKDLREEIKSQSKTIFEILIMASLVEKEARKNEDRKIVADVFYKRLKIGKALESCATINYILGNNKKLSFEDTKIKSPYNTYINPGLPPGPICNPSLSSIKAAIYPEKTNYWYFLSKDDGEIIFSKTIEEHNRNKAKYLK
ncbi:MAG: conserved hypothetical protein TIGR00247 [Parcubacteria group bacterium Athens1014_10]|nr:MAG: conserved hypothetical protein TIGR00247 [Parcubacteria group bacterium Athens1014_10]TSD05993.1 MAG: conserved hypothetical protein TIGR00247 [Parcubacteria group bacterium Athens0714_12]